MYRSVENTALAPNRHSAGMPPKHRWAHSYGMRCVEEVAAISTERFIPNGMKRHGKFVQFAQFVDRNADFY
jgi:hypothetical protein